ncbi:hypothetical protein BH11BAC7_BH11BAC7_04540 [soil metagenome]
MKKNPSFSRASIAISDELNYFGLDCTDPEVNAYYAGIHAISKDTYEKMIKNFFPGTIPAEYPRTAASLNVSANDCDDYVKFNTGTSTTANDIIITIEVVIPVIGKYSIHFFRALQSHFSNIGGYKFSKAKSDDGVETMVMRVVDVAGNTLYHGDLTNMYP